jgi:hypothetical protein
VRIHGAPRSQQLVRYECAPFPMTDKPPKSDARVGGMVAAVVLVLLAVFVVVFVWMGS